MRDPPSGRVLEKGPDWFLVATEACDGGTSDLEHLMYVLSCISVVTMGYHVPLDVCFGDQLPGSAHEPMHRGWHMFSS